MRSPQWLRPCSNCICARQLARLILACLWFLVRLAASSLAWPQMKWSASVCLATHQEIWFKFSFHWAKPTVFQEWKLVQWAEPEIFWVSGCPSFFLKFLGLYTDADFVSQMGFDCSVQRFVYLFNFFHRLSASQYQPASNAYLCHPWFQNITFLHVKRRYKCASCS